MISSSPVPRLILRYNIQQPWALMDDNESGLHSCSLGGVENTEYAISL